MDAKRLAEALKSLDNQNFGPNDSTILSTINHPVNAGGKFLDWLKNQVNTAAGIPEQYDNPYPLLAPSPDAQSQAAFDVAGMAQLGGMPFAPKSAGGTVGTLARPAAASDNLNESLLQKYLQQGSLTPDELAQYERNAIAMRDSNRQFLNVANADAQGGTAMDRARDMGFDTPAYHATQSDLRNITPSIDGYMGEGIYLSDDAKEAAFFGARKGVEGLNILPVKIKGNITKWDGDDYRHQSAQNADIRKSGYDGAFKNFNDINTEFNIFKPENIRSRFAAFDPLRKDSADLLATKILPATMLGWGMANQKPDNQSLAEALRGGN